MARPQKLPLEYRADLVERQMSPNTELKLRTPIEGTLSRHCTLKLYLFCAHVGTIDNERLPTVTAAVALKWDR